MPLRAKIYAKNQLTVVGHICPAGIFALWANLPLFFRFGVAIFLPTFFSDFSSKQYSSLTAASYVRDTNMYNEQLKKVSQEIGLN